jgi:FNIP Repeat
MTTLSPQKAIVYSPYSIPSGATELTLIIYNTFNIQDFLQKLPPTLISLTLQNNIGHVTQLPKTLTILITEYEFNQKVDKLPPTLTHLTTGKKFNQPVDRLPPTLTHLTTGSCFNQKVNKLPPTLTHLTTGYCFNQPVNKLPPTLTSQLDVTSPSQLINYQPRAQ